MTTTSFRSRPLESAAPRAWLEPFRWLDTARTEAKIAARQADAAGIQSADSASAGTASAGTQSTGTEKATARFDGWRIAPFLLLHVACLAVFWVGVSPIAIAVCAASYLLRMFAITAFYHRYFAHRSFRTSRFMQFLFALLGASATQRGPLWWAAHHRRHHRHADRPGDPHRPADGMLRAHVGWFLRDENFATDRRRVRDWLRFPELVLVNRFDAVVPLAYAAALYALGGWLGARHPDLRTSGPQLLVWGYCVATVLLTHATLLVNSAAHKWGHRRFATADDSRNNVWVALLTLGEGWHNNHHRFAGSARQGFYWWQFDPTYWLLRVMAACGLIWGLRDVPAMVRAEGRSGRRRAAAAQRSSNGHRP